MIRQRGNLQYQVISESNTMHNADCVLSDQAIRLTNYFTKQKYPALLRRVTYYATDKNNIFVYPINNMEIPAKQVALLYKYRWRVELFLKLIKQHPFVSVQFSHPFSRDADKQGHLAMFHNSNWTKILII